MERLRQDLLVALRGLLRTPTFAVAVLAILGLGIGMAVAMFTTFQTVLLRRLPVREQDRIDHRYLKPVLELLDLHLVGVHLGLWILVELFVGVVHVG